MKKRPLLSGWILWFGVGTIAAFLIYAAYFGWSAYKLFTSTGLPSPMETFVSPQFHISIQHPRTWFASELPDGNHGDLEVIAFISGGGPMVGASVSIARKSFSQPAIDGVAQWGLSRLYSRLNQDETIDLISTTVPDQTSLLRRYSRRYQTFLGPGSIECLDWYTYSGPYGYDLSFCVQAKYWAQMNELFLQMARSFRVE